MKSLRFLLLPLSFLYWLFTTLRNWFFDIGILRVTRVRVPVVSVGNIFSGGTGKTPFVEVIVRKLQSRRRRPAVISRGYGRSSRGYLLVSDGKGAIASARDGGDEPVQLAENLKNTVVAVDELRVDGSRKVLETTTSDSIVLDDGFQHRFLHRDLDIVLLTAREILSGDWLLPAGNRRETMNSLRRADVVVISKCKDLQHYEKSRMRLSNKKFDVTVGFRLIPLSLRRVSDGKCVERSSALGMRVMTVAGLGDPDSFRSSVEEFGCTVANSVTFPDHHWYSTVDLKVLREKFAKTNVAMMVTTHKDLVRMRSLGKEGEEFFQEVALCVLDVRVEFIAGEDVVDRLIEQVTS